MAYGRPSNVKDNFGRFQRYATINLTKALQNIADTTQTNLRDDIAKKLEEVYKKNVEASYTPRNNGSYIHTDTFVDSIHTVIEEDKGIGRDRIKIVLDNDVYDQPSERTVAQVYDFLTEGTAGGSRKGGLGIYGYDTDDGPKLAYNYPTPKHEFELWTQLDMKGYLAGITSDLKRGEYSKNRR